MDRLSLRLLLAQSADVATFLFFYLFIGAGAHQERNPLLLALMSVGGVYAVAALKMGITGFVVWRRLLPSRPSRFRALRWLACRFPNLWPRMVTIDIAMATASGIAGAGFNIASILHSLAR